MPPTDLPAIANAPHPEVVRLLDRAARPPLPRVRCSYCAATAHRMDPPGWLIANPIVNLGLAPFCGVCPDCLTAVYDFPAE